MRNYYYSSPPLHPPTPLPIYGYWSSCNPLRVLKIWLFACFLLTYAKPPIIVLYHAVANIVYLLYLCMLVVHLTTGHHQNNILHYFLELHMLLYIYNLHDLHSASIYHLQEKSVLGKRFHQCLMNCTLHNSTLLFQTSMVYNRI